jgi:small subunit ribosomal protein S17
MAGTSPGDGAEEVTSGQGSPAVDAPAAAPPPAPAKQVPHTAASKPAPATGQSRSAAAIAGEPRSGRRKVREGIVASSAMDKTAVVLVVERVRHARYAKTVQRTKRLYAHDEANDVKVGDRVRLAETRPLSKLKRWRVEQVLERAR